MEDKLPARLPAKTPLSIGNQGIRPSNIDELWRLCEMLVIGGIAPKGFTKEQTAGVIAFGLELGLSPIQSLQDIAFINAKPLAYGQAISGLLLNSGLLADVPQETIEGEGDLRTATCTMTRLGVKGFVTRKFSMADAKRAQLLGKDNWAKYPDRMLRWRAFNQAARDLFADVLKGLWVREVGEDNENFAPQGPRIKEHRPLIETKIEEVSSVLVSPGVPEPVLTPDQEAEMVKIHEESVKTREPGQEG